MDSIKGTSTCNTNALPELHIINRAKCNGGNVDGSLHQFDLVFSHSMQLVVWNWKPLSNPLIRSFPLVDLCLPGELLQNAGMACWSHGAQWCKQQCCINGYSHKYTAFQFRGTQVVTFFQRSKLLHTFCQEPVYTCAYQLRCASWTVVVMLTNC